MAMKLVKKTAEYTIYQRSDDRYAVKDANKKPVNGDEKVRILLAEELIKVACRGARAETRRLPKRPAPRKLPAEEAPAEEEAPPRKKLPRKTPAEEEATSKPVLVSCKPASCRLFCL